MIKDPNNSTHVDMSSEGSANPHTEALFDTTNPMVDRQTLNGIPHYEAKRLDEVTTSETSQLVEQVSVIIEKEIKEKEKEKDPIPNEEKVDFEERKKFLLSMEAMKNLLTTLFVWIMTVIGCQGDAMANLAAVC